MKDVRKGTLVVLRNGWEAIVEDNLTNRATRMCKVYGTYTEMGSCYSSDIHSALINGQWELVRHTPAQLKAAENRKLFGF
jgi:hypothetical protein